MKLFNFLLFLFLASIYLLEAWVQTDDYPEKLWLHRTNSLEKLAQKGSAFPNIEVDVVVRNAGPDSVGFDVTHDVDTTFHLGLRPYFKRADSLNSRIWLDVKNLTPANAGASLRELESLRRSEDVALSQLIVESRQVDALEPFTRAGYYTSYYVDFPKPIDLSEEEERRLVGHLDTIAASGKVRALSFPGWWYRPIKHYLHSGIDLLTWKHYTTRFGMTANPLNRALLNDPQLKVILVKSKSHYDR